jgi:hypothetical protein
MRTLLTFALCCFLVSGTNAYAWDDEGHMTVAAIAYDKLDKNVRTAVAALLKLNPNYKQWITGVPANERDKVAFVEAATWPDFIKGAAGYTNDDLHKSGSKAAQNIGYTDKLQHRYWHFIDMPFSPDETKLIDPVPPNAKTQIAEFRKSIALSSKVSARIKSYDLVWLLHLVGDVHQPLHATSRFESTEPKGDRGGNDVTACTSSCGPLHAFWDDVLGTSKSPADAQNLAEAIPAADDTLAAISDEAVWINESFEFAKDSVYIAPIGVGKGPFTLDKAYQDAARDLATKRVALAGARLANLLSEALK